MIRVTIRVPDALLFQLAADPRGPSAVARAALAACATAEPAPPSRRLTQLGFRAHRRAYDLARAHALVRGVPLQRLFAGALGQALASGAGASEAP